MTKKELPDGVKAVATADGIRYESVVWVRIAGTRKQVRRRFPTVKEAVEFREESRVSSRYGMFAQDSLEPLGEYLDRWLTLKESNGGYRANTLDAYRTQLKNRFHKLMQTPLAHLTPAMIDTEIARSMGAGLKANSLHTAQSALITALDEAIPQGMIRVNVARLATWPKRTPAEIEIIGERELDLILGAIGGRTREPLYRLLLDTGMRIGEALGLEWRHLDLDALTVGIEQTVVRNGNRVAMQRYVKSDAGMRIVRLDARLVPYLLQQRETCKLLAAAGGAPFGPGSPIFPGANRIGRMGGEGVRDDMARLCLKLRIPIYTPHAFRHTVATQMVKAGIDPKTIAERLGHDSVRTVFDYYVHPSPVDHQTAAQLLADRMYRGVSVEVAV